jgi:hypothetical protein
VRRLRRSTSSDFDPHSPGVVAILRVCGECRLRALLESLQLDVAYQPEQKAIDVTITLYDATESAEDWSVPPAGLEPVPGRVTRLRQRLALTSKAHGCV